MGRVAGVFRRQIGALLSRVAEGQVPRGRHLLLLWLFGSASLAVVTWISFRFGLHAETVAFVYLTVIVLLSLLDSFVSSAVFSVVAIALLDYFFVEPLFSFSVGSAEDILTLASFVGTSLVITGLVRRLRNLAATHRQHAQLLNLTHDSILIRDMDNVVTFWNRGAAELYGYDRTEILGKPVRELLQTQFPIPFDEIMQVLLTTGRWDGELIRTRKDGTRVIVSSRWSLQRDAAGRPIGTLETNNDITERKYAQEALERSQAAYLAEAQKLSATGSFSWNAVSGEIVWSDESFRIFEYDPTAKPSLDAILQRVHPEDILLVESMLGRAAQDRQGFDFEHRLLMANGSVKHLRMVASPVAEASDGLQFVGAMMDVTGAKQSQELLQHAQAELAYVTRITTLGEMAASIAHEVNQPLAAIVTSGDASLRFLAQTPPQLDEVRDGVMRIVADGKRAGEIVQRIRTLTKKTKPQSEPLDLNDVVTEGVALVQRELTNNRVVLRADLADPLPIVLGDKVQLQQVIINLMINGIQAMGTVYERPRELTVRSYRDDAGQAVVAVADCGSGIDPQVASRLFEAFFTTKSNGMGMGLSICRTIIQAHGGRIWASANTGPGATFQFSLPPAGESTP